MVRETRRSRDRSAIVGRMTTWEHGSGTLTTDQVDRIREAIQELRIKYEIPETRGWQRALERATSGRLRQPTISTVMTGRCGYNAAKIIAANFAEPQKKLVEFLTGAAHQTAGRYSAMSMRFPTLAPVLDSLVTIYPVDFLDELAASEPANDASHWSAPDWVRWVVANWDARRPKRTGRK